MWVRVEKVGFEPVEFATFGGALLGKNIPLSPSGGVPAGMIAILVNHSWTGPDYTMELPSYFLDKFEVTNRQFKDFIDAGGYRDSKYWRYAFVRQGRDAPFDLSYGAVARRYGQAWSERLGTRRLSAEPGRSPSFRSELV